MSKYENERYTPKIPACVKATISLLLDGKVLSISLKDKTLVSYSAVSGKPVKGEFDYSVQRQKITFQGPIPEGEYWITFEEIWSNAWYRPGSTDAWGNFRIAIHPYPKTNTYSRGGFFIHGGIARGSSDCIDLTHHMDSFVRETKTKLLTKNCYIPLTVKY